jgi:radical SAM-linked protein
MVSSVEVVTPQTRYTPYRIRYTKTGNLKYISHLDLLRTMQRILLRAELPLWYTEGFNPQPKLSFGLPLSVGCESICEYIDIRLTETLPCEEVAARISAAFPREMCVVKVYHPETKYNTIGAAGYEMEIRSAGVDEATPARVKDLFAHELMVEKETKRGSKMLDLSAAILSLSASYEDGGLKLAVVLPASNDQYINPELLIAAMQTHLGILVGNPMEESCELIRTEVYLADGETVFA